MSERYRAVVDISYPTPSSLKKVLAAGGLSKMSQAEREKVTLRQIKAGSYADDIPDKSVKWLLKSGLIKPAASRGKGKK